MHRIVAKVKQSTRNPTIAIKSRREKIPQDLQKMRQTALRQRRPRRESPPKFRSPCSDASSFLDRSTHSDSSISQIYLKISYAPAYKKSKIKQKVQTVMRSVKAAWRARGTIVRRDRWVKSFRYCFVSCNPKYQMMPGR